MTRRNGYLCEERAGRLFFGTSALTLIFDLKTGCWTGAASARDFQDFCAVRRRIQPKGALYVGWLDNHDSWNNGCLETGLFMAEKYSKPYARALLAAALFQEGAYMAYSGTEKLDPDFYRAFLRLRRDSAVFSEGECSYEAVRADDENVYACRWTLNGQTAAVLVNLSDHPVSAAVSGLSGVFVDQIEGGAWNAEETLTLPPCGVRVYFGA